MIRYDMIDSFVHFYIDFFMEIKVGDNYSHSLYFYLFPLCPMLKGHNLFIKI